MPRYRKKPVEIDAWQWNGQSVSEWPIWLRVYHEKTEPRLVFDGMPGGALLIHTLEGVMRAEPLDWIIRGVKGEIYPCKPDIFAATYDPVP